MFVLSFNECLVSGRKNGKLKKTAHLQLCSLQKARQIIIINNIELIIQSHLSKEIAITNEGQLFTYKIY